MKMQLSVRKTFSPRIQVTIISASSPASGGLARKKDKKTKQAGAELCQAQDQLCRAEAQLYYLGQLQFMNSMTSSTPAEAEADTGAGLSLEIEFGLGLSLAICSKYT